ncbi:uncharacterized protein A4U43_C08F29350 [Asparagus officinalis]|nr:uncharacterized protein A4U43_C08F29350 [Asparagus officinalis]
MLASVSIVNCHKLKHLSWLLNLPLLAVLDVRWCKRMEHVIRGEEEEEEAREMEHERQAPSRLIPPAIFPALRTLRLQTLPELKSICNDRAVSLPRLEHLLVSYCDTPASCSRLKKIEARRGWWEDTLELDGDMRSHLQSRFVESLY